MGGPRAAQPRPVSLLRSDQGLDRGDKPVAAPGERFDLPRRFRVVAERRPHLLDCVIDALLEINEDAGVPQ